MLILSQPAFLLIPLLLKSYTSTCTVRHWISWDVDNNIFISNITQQCRFLAAIIINNVKACFTCCTEKCVTFHRYYIFLNCSILKNDIFIYSSRLKIYRPWVTSPSFCITKLAVFWGSITVCLLSETA